MYTYSWFYFVCSLETLERDNVRLRMAAAILISIPVGLGFDILWSQVVFGGQQPTPANLMIVPAFMGIAATVLLMVAIRRSQIVHDRRIRRGERPPTKKIPGRSQSDSQDEEEGGIVCPVKARRKLNRENSLKAHRMGALWMCPHGLRHKECDECIALEGGGNGDVPTDEENEGLVCPVKARRKLNRENSLKAHRMGALWMCPHGLRHKECDECIALEGGGDGGGDAHTERPRPQLVHGGESKRGHTHTRMKGRKSRAQSAERGTQQQVAHFFHQSSMGDDGTTTRAEGGAACKIQQAFFRMRMLRLMKLRRRKSVGSLLRVFLATCAVTVVFWVVVSIGKSTRIGKSFALPH